MNRGERGERREKKRENELAGSVIGAAIEVHRELGPGLLETAYESCLAHEMVLRGITFERQKPVPVSYKTTSLDCGFRVDLLVENLVVVELKTVEKLHPVHSAQILTYLRLTRCKLGLLLNFNVNLVRDGIKRFALDL